MKFNLASYLGFMKEAMGAARFSNRAPLEVWSYDKLANAPEDSRDPEVLSFRQWAEAMPELNGVLSEASVRRSRYLDKIKKEYGMAADQAQHILKLFIGYEPKQGAYILFVGPYFSKGERHGIEHVRKEGIDKFIGSTLTFAPNSIRGCKASLDKLVEKLNSQYQETTEGEETGIVFDENDFKLVDKEPKRLDENGKVNTGNVRQEIDNIGELEPLIPNPQDNPEIEQRNDEIRQQNAARNPDGAEFFNGRLLPNAQFELSQNGWEKLIQNLMGPW